MIDSLFGSGGGESKGKATPWRTTDGSLKRHIDMIRFPEQWEMYDGRLRPDRNKYTQQADKDVRKFSEQYRGYGKGMMDEGAGMMLGGYGGAMDHYGNALGQGPVQMQDTQGILQNAAMYADNPYLSGQIDAVNRDVSRSLFEQEMPGIAAASAGSGNLGSSRRGMLEGMAMRGASDRMADNAATMRSGAYNQGLSYANQIAQQNANLNMQNRNMQMNAANQMAGLGGAGMNMATTGQNMFGAQNQMLGNVGQARTARSQQGMDLANQQHWLAQQLPYMQANMGMQTLLPAASAFGTNTQKGGGGGGFGNLMNMGLGMAGSFAGMGG